MSKVVLTNELLTEIREQVFGPCTVVYEAMTNEEVKEDIMRYLSDNRVFVKGEKEAIYKPSLTILTFKSWLLLRLQVELMDIDPETPFDRSDEEIRKASIRRKETENRLTSNIKLLIARLRYEVNKNTL
jgi:hypothetical protein